MNQGEPKCAICSQSIDEDDIWRLACGHVLCSSCFGEDSCAMCLKEKSVSSSDTQSASPGSTAGSIKILSQNSQNVIVDDHLLPSAVREVPQDQDDSAVLLDKNQESRTPVSSRLQDRLSCHGRAEEKYSDAQKQNCLEEIDRRIKLLESVKQEVDTLKNQRLENQVTAKTTAPDVITQSSSAIEETSDLDKLLSSLENLRMTTKLARISDVISQTLSEVNALQLSANQSAEEKPGKDENQCSRCLCDSPPPVFDGKGEQTVAVPDDLSHTNKDFAISCVEKMEYRDSQNMSLSSFITHTPMSDLMSKLPGGSLSRYQPAIGTDLTLNNGDLFLVRSRWQVVTAMDEFRSKSFEELRLEHYRKRPFWNYAYFRKSDTTLSDQGILYNKFRMPSTNGHNPFTSLHSTISGESCSSSFLTSTPQSPSPMQLFGNGLNELGLNLQGTRVKYAPTTGTDTMTSNGVSTNIRTRLEVITGMKEYENKSFEELRFEHYLIVKRTRSIKARYRRVRFNKLRMSSANSFNPFTNSQSANSEKSGPFSLFTNSPQPPLPAKLFSIGSDKFCISFQGTPVKYNPVIDTDTMIRNGVSTNVRTRLEVITEMKEYQNKSFEELRVEDYLAKCSC